MRRLLLTGILVAALAGSAEALTIRDVIELARAGLGDEVLLALIDVDRGVYAIDTATLKQLKAAGVSDRVIAALVRSGREFREPDVAVTEQQEPDQPAPQVVVIDHHDQDVERVREVPVPVMVPVYIPVVTRRHRGTVPTHDAITTSQDSSTFVPFQSGRRITDESHPRKAEQVYWGFGGKLRPDAWQPSPGDVKPPDRRK
jgi:hypothetical protein